MKIAKRRVLDEEITIRTVKEKINDVYETRFTRLRTEHPEFSDLSDADLQAYIEVYDDHMGLGFLPHSMALMVGGCFMLFCSWLFFIANHMPVGPDVIAEPFPLANVRGTRRRRDPND